MVEAAIAVGAVPAEWLYDDRFLITIIDILHSKTEAGKKRGR